MKLRIDKKRLVLLFGGAITATVVVACTLNPQPLPPGDDNASDFPGGEGSSGGSSSGFGGQDAGAVPAPPEDSGEQDTKGDGGIDAGGNQLDGGDGGDAGDGGSADASDSG